MKDNIMYVVWWRICCVWSFIINIF